MGASNDRASHTSVQIVITRGIDPYTGKEAMLSVQVRGAPNLTWIESHNEKRTINGQEVDVLVVDNVYQHPAVARHQALARQLTAIGKNPPGKE